MTQTKVTPHKAWRGRANELRGRAAEGAVERHYERSGMWVAHRRWRGRTGEIDLIARQGDTVIFIEVKAGVSHDVAMARLGRAQLRRIEAAVGEFLALEPAGQLTDIRFDVATVDGWGRVQVLENALAA